MADKSGTGGLTTNTVQTTYAGDVVSTTNYAGGNTSAKGTGTDPVTGITGTAFSKHIPMSV